jgi:hypothetical protein
MLEIEKLPSSLGAVLFVHAYDKLLSCREKGDTPQKALKCMGLLNAIAWREARGETVTFALLADIMSTTKPGVWRLLEYLKRLNLVSIDEQDIGITKTHVIHAPQPITGYLQNVLREYGPPDENGRFRDTSADVALMINDAGLRIIHGRRSSETPTFALQTIGLFLVIVGLNAGLDVVNRCALAKRIGMTENAFRPKLDYLAHLGLITVSEAQVENNIAREFRMEADEKLVTAVRQLIDRKNRELKFLECCSDNEQFIHQQVGSR